MSAGAHLIRRFDVVVIRSKPIKKASCVLHGELHMINNVEIDDSLVWTRGAFTYWLRVRW